MILLRKVYKGRQLAKQKILGLTEMPEQRASKPNPKWPERRMKLLMKTLGVDDTPANRQMVYDKFYPKDDV